MTEETFKGIPIPVLKGLARVRESGRTNMLDSVAVRSRLLAEGFDYAERWLHKNDEKYTDALVAMGNYVFPESEK